MPKNVQYITDEEGRKTAAILPIDEYEMYLEFLEDLHLSRVARESKDEQRRPFAEVLEKIRAAGEIDV